MIKMLDIPTLGPRKVMALNRALGIETVDQLERAAREGKIEDLDGFGLISQENILKGIEVLAASHGRMLLGEAFPKAMSMVDYLRCQCKEQISDISITGSLRRMRETIGDIDILVAPSFAPDRRMNGGSHGTVDMIMDAFNSHPKVEDVLARGDTKSSVRLRDGTQVDLRVIERESWGAALQYFTGSKEHNVAVRKIAIEQGLKINEYGVYHRENGEKLAGVDEVEVYERLGLQYIPPEAREDRGELELAARGGFPELVSMEDIRGDLHIHTDRSDGTMSLCELAAQARGLGYDYVGIADHSPRMKMTRGPDARRMLEYIEETRKAREELDDVFLLAGSEVDIHRDGSLDYPDHVLEELDIVIASVHSGFSLGEKEMTERIVTALSSGHVNILAHPTARKIGRRDPVALDMRRIVEVAVDNGVALEVNSMPVRLDLNMDHILMAMEMGAKLAINTDSHTPRHLEVMRYGVATARKGRATKHSVINTWDRQKLMRFLDG